MSLLSIDNLSVNVESSGEVRPVLNGLKLQINPGEVHAIMGPNGSGKSTLAHVVARKPGYSIQSGVVLFKDQLLNEMEPEEVAQSGLFLGFQYPVEIPGVSNMEFLKASSDSLNKARSKEPESTTDFMKRVRSIASSLDLDQDFLKRGVNEGFSGGEKKRNEILQMLVLKPDLAVLDETDSGLDIDALKTVSNGVNAFRESSNGVLLITHYQRLLDYVVPDFVHVLSEGRIIQSGDKSLALELESKGYAWLQ
ncbi:MAG: Fe-S cluster assembly ATPase SufC [Gammaproteobacteria bacterium]|nr:Fe-S cluster assembly ATPase SufC [Gammaproteobacteria bacterium]